MSEEVKPPTPYVKKPRLIKYGGIDPGLRPGRGFSVEEIKAAGLTVKEARNLGIYVDERRKTKHEWNVRMLVEFLKKIKWYENRGIEPPKLEQ